MMISVAHSPDTDDDFLFWAIVNNRIDLQGLEFSFSTHDTAQLNELAINANADVIAISVAVYPRVASSYLILPHGASVGRNYGPVVVARKSLPVEALRSARIGIPGKTTTAAALLALALPHCKMIEYPIVPFNLGFNALFEDQIDALLLIHEGQLSFRERNLALVLDLGVWWTKEYHLPLPLGVNVIARTLELPLISRISQVLKESIRYGLSHREDALEDLLSHNLSRRSDLKTIEDIRRYLDMYANEDSLELRTDSKEAISILLNSDNSLLEAPPMFRIEYAP